MLRLFLPALLLASAALADQPQMGEHFTRNMVSPEKNLPSQIDPANPKYKIKLGSETYSTPAIAEGRIVVGLNNNSPRDPRHKGDRGVLFCLEEATGKFLWQLVCPKIEGDNYKDWPNIGMMSCPTIEGDRVYTVTNKGEVVCLDLKGMADGNDGPFKDEAVHQSQPKLKEIVPVADTDADIIWLTDLPKEVGIYNHDTSYCSPLIVGDYLYCNTSNGVDMTHKKIRKPDAPSLVVIEKKTGRIVARDNENIGFQIIHASWSSPAFGQINGKDTIFFGGGNGVMFAFDPITASPPEGTILNLKRIWTFDPDPAGPKEKTVDHEYTNNHETSQSNIVSNPVLFENKLFLTVGGDFWWGKNKAWIQCIDPAAPAESATLWSYEMKKSITTPAVTKEITVVGDTGNHLIVCLDTTTGKPLWTHKTKGDLWAPALIADGKIFFGTMTGEFFIFEAAREKKLLSETKFDAPIGSAPVAANGALYITTHKNLYAFTK